MITDSPPITGVVLCGGRGQRMGGQDKGLLTYQGQPLVFHAIRALSVVTDTIIINANRNHDAYRAWGYPVFSDADDRYAGPLAGLLMALRQARTPWVLCLPCDMPHFDGDCLTRLYRVWRNHDCDICTVTDGNRLYPVVALVNSNLAESLACYLARGERKVESWFSKHRLIKVDYHDCPGVLTNLNTPEDWSEAKLETTKNM